MSRLFDRNYPTSGLTPWPPPLHRFHVAEPVDGVYSVHDRGQYDKSVWRSRVDYEAHQMAIRLNVEWRRWQERHAPRRRRPTSGADRP